MKKRVGIIGMVLACVAGAWFFWGRSRGEDATVWLGYVEGEPLLIAAPVSGTLAERYVERGASVRAGVSLFSLDTVTSDAETARLAAQADAARAQLSDLAQERQRQPELDVARANETAALAQLAKAQRDYQRFATLSAKGFVSKAQLDSAKAARDVAAATLAQTRAQLRSGEMTAGRAGQLQAAAAQVTSAQASVRAQQRRRAEISPVAPATGLIEQTFYNPGEWVPANAPVLSLLPDDKRKIRFFVPQDRVAAIKPGAAIRFTCDGCAGELQATVRYIAPRAEFTPPVIFSERARTKLVFMIEASLPVSNALLPLGLPVEVIGW